MAQCFKQVISYIIYMTHKLEDNFILVFSRKLNFDPNISRKILQLDISIPIQNFDFSSNLDTFLHDFVDYPVK